MSMDRIDHRRSLHACDLPVKLSGFDRFGWSDRFAGSVVFFERRFFRNCHGDIQRGGWNPGRHLDRNDLRLSR